MRYLHRNYLKSREDAKEAPQNFDSERVISPGPPKTHRLWGGAIAEWLRTLENSPGDCFPGKQVNAVNWPGGGTSEKRNCEIKPTPAETDFSNNFGVQQIWISDTRKLEI